MPTRPSQLMILNKTYNPPRLPDVTEQEIFCSLDTSVRQGTPATAATSASAFGNFGASDQGYALFRFDLTGYKEGLIDFVSAVLAWAVSSNGTQAPFTIGRIKDADAASWTQNATYNTKDGAVAWTGGAGGFRNAATEFSWTPAAMPGVTTGGRYVSLNEGTFPYQQFYHGNADTNFPTDTFATFLDAAISAHNGFVNFYLFCPSTSQTIRATPNAGERESKMRLVMKNVTVNDGLRWYGNDTVQFPPFSDITSQHSVAKTLFSTYMDMASVDAANPTRNGSKCPLTTKMAYTFGTDGAGASQRYLLLHFNLSSYIGKTFSSATLRLYVGDQAGTTAGMTVFAGQSAYSWGVGDGECTSGTPGTTGPTYNHQEKLGSVAWPGGINVGSASFLDTVGQAETAHTGAPSSISAGNPCTPFSIDITGMVNRALTNYAGHLFLRIRCTSNAGATPEHIIGPGEFLKITAAGSPASNLIEMGFSGQSGSFAAVSGYRACPHLQLKMTDPTP